MQWDLKSSLLNAAVDTSVQADRQARLQLAVDKASRALAEVMAELAPVSGTLLLAE
jgi:hypothetical protein